MKQWLRVIFSIIMAASISLLGYFMKNIPNTFFDNLEEFTWLEYARQNFQKVSKAEDSFVRINVAYDKALVDYSDEYGLPLGNVTVTDRQKLNALLTLLDNNSVYRYIILDIEFPADIVSPYDSALFSQINRMERICVATHIDSDSSDYLDSTKLAFADYSSTITSTNFVRFQYLQKKGESIPLKMAKEINQIVYSKQGPFFFSNGKLSINSPFISFPSPIRGPYDEEGQQNYYNLGVDILEMMQPEDISAITEGKVVIIGDYVEDTHDTYCGVLPGPYILETAYNTLASGKNKIQWVWELLLFFVYFFVSLAVIQGFKIEDLIPFVKKKKNTFYNLIFSLLSYSVIFIILQILIFFISGIPYNMYLPSFVFPIVSYFYNHLKQ